MIGKICKTFVKAFYGGKLAAQRLFELFLLSLALMALNNLLSDT
jgi:hypothetical protein